MQAGSKNWFRSKWQPVPHQIRRHTVRAFVAAESQIALPARAGMSNPVLIASSLLGAALANAAGSDGAVLAADLIELQRRLERRLKG